MKMIPLCHEADILKYLKKKKIKFTGIFLDPPPQSYSKPEDDI